MGSHTIKFIADSTGESITFRPITGAGAVVFEITDVSLKRVLVDTQVLSWPVKKFLSGESDSGDEIFFRIDTIPINLHEDFEIYVNPISVLTKTKRGMLMKVFVGLDDNPFFELKGDVSKGVSILKVSQEGQGKPTNPLCQNIRLSYRDSSKQRCRIMHSAILYLPTPMDYSA
jgi:hypothetical protein